MSVEQNIEPPVPKFDSRPILTSISIEEVGEIGDHFGHLSPHEIIGNFVLKPECKIILADMQIGALEALQLSTERDQVETEAWEECRTRAANNTPIYDSLYI